MRVLVSHPHRLFSEALMRSLQATEGIESIESCSIDDLSSTTADQWPDVLVISGRTFVTIKDEIVERLAGRKVGFLVISSSPDPDELATALKAGATGYIGIDCSWKQLSDAIAKVGAGEVVVAGVDRSVFDSGAENPQGPTISEQRVMNTLTPREREVLNLLSKGFSNRQIAEDLFLSEHTVRTHVQNLRGKLNVRSKFQAAVLAMHAAGTSERAGGDLSSYRF